GHDERNSETPRGKVSGQADDWRIGEGHHNVWAFKTQAGIASGEEVANVIAEPSHESLLRKPRSPCAKDLNAPVLLSGNEVSLRGSGSVARGWKKRDPGDDGDPAAVLLDQTF